MKSTTAEQPPVGVNMSFSPHKIKLSSSNKHRGLGFLTRNGLASAIELEEINDSQKKLDRNDLEKVIQETNRDWPMPDRFHAHSIMGPENTHHSTLPITAELVNLDFFNQNLGELWLNNRTIARCDFHHCTAEGINFNNVKISRSRFINCKFINCTFTHCSISRSAFYVTTDTELTFNECEIKRVFFNVFHKAKITAFETLFNRCFWRSRENTEATTASILQWGPCPGHDFKDQNPTLTLNLSSSHLLSCIFGCTLVSGELSRCTIGRCLMTSTIASISFILCAAERFYTNNCKFRNTNFAGTEVHCGNFNQTIFRECCIYNCSMLNTDLTTSALSGCNIDGWNLSSPSFINTSLDYCIVENMAFSQGVLHKLILQNCDMINCSLTGLQTHAFRASNTTFTACNLEASYFPDARILEAEFHNCNLSKCILHDTSLAHSRLIDCNAEKTEFDDCDMSYSHISRMTAPKAELRNCTLTSAVIDNSLLVDVDLTQSNFTKARLLNSNLSGSNIYALNMTDWEIDGSYASHLITACKGKQIRIPFEGDYGPDEFQKRFNANTIAYPIHNSDDILNAIAATRAINSNRPELNIEVRSIDLAAESIVLSVPNHDDMQAACELFGLVFLKRDPEDAYTFLRNRFGISMPVDYHNSPLADQVKQIQEQLEIQAQQIGSIMNQPKQIININNSTVGNQQIGDHNTQNITPSSPAVGKLYADLEAILNSSQEISSEDKEEALMQAQHAKQADSKLQDDPSLVERIRNKLNGITTLCTSYTALEAAVTPIISQILSFYA